MKILKTISVVLLIGVSVLVSYAVGYFNGTNESALFLSTNNAIMNFAALNFIENQQLEKIRKLHENEVEINMATIDDILGIEHNYFRMPQRVKLYHDFFVSDPKQIIKLRENYSRLRNKNNLTSH